MDEIWKAFLETQPKTVGEVYDAMTDEQKDALHYLIGSAIESERARIVRRIIGE